MKKLVIFFAFSFFCSTANAAWQKEDFTSVLGAKKYIIDPIQTKNVIFIREKGNTVFIIEGKAVVLTHLFEYSEPQLNENVGEIYKYKIIEEAVLCGKNNYGSINLFIGEYGGRYKPYHYDYRDDQNLIAKGSYQYSGKSALSKSFRPISDIKPIKNNYNYSLDKDFSKLCSQYGNRLNTKFFIGPKNNRRSAKFEFDREGLQQVGFERFFDFEFIRNVEKSSAKPLIPKSTQKQQHKQQKKQIKQNLKGAEDECDGNAICEALSIPPVKID